MWKYYKTICVNPSSTFLQKFKKNNNSIIIVTESKLLSHIQLFVTHGSYPTRLLCPWNFPGKNTGVVCHSLLQQIFSTQVSCIAGRFFTIWATRDTDLYLWVIPFSLCIKQTFSYVISVFTNFLSSCVNFIQWLCENVLSIPWR